MTYLQKKKLAFMSIVNSVKGFLRTVTGIPPLTLPNCVDENSIINYTISGNSVQDGTPSPDNPIEIESVGEKTANLFDVNNPFLIGGYISNNKLLSYNATYDSSPTVTIVLPIKSNTPYTASRKLLGKRFALATSPNAPAASIELTNYTGSNGYTAENLTITSGNDDKYLYVWFCNANFDTYTYQELMQEIQIVEGTEILPYEPYGYKIPVKASGKNLFDKNKATQGEALSIQTGGTYGAPTYLTTDYIQIETGKTYSYNWKTPRWYNLYDENKNYIEYGANKQKFKNTKATYVRFCADLTELDTFQFEEGTATEYEPYAEPITTNIYLNEPLRKINDYADYIDFENQKVVRNIKEVVLTGTEDWIYTSEFKAFYISHDGNLMTLQTPMCTHLVGIASGVGSVDNSLLINRWSVYITKLDLGENVDALIEFLKKSNVRYIHPLLTSTEENINLSKLPMFKGTTIYSIDTTTQPSYMSATYYSTSKGD